MCQPPFDIFCCVKIDVGTKIDFFVYSKAYTKNNLSHKIYLKFSCVGFGYGRIFSEFIEFCVLFFYSFFKLILLRSNIVNFLIEVLKTKIVLLIEAVLAGRYFTFIVEKHTDPVG